MAGFGYLGEKIALLLQKENFALTVVTRSARQKETSGIPGINFVGCDLAENVPDLPRREFDTAIFCLAPGRGAYSADSYRLTYCEAQRNFLQAFTARQYIFISSTAVYPDAPGRYDESMAIAHSERAQILLAAEQIALQQENGCVLRLAGLYSTDRPIYRAQGPAYADDKLVHFIHRDDAARAVLHAVKKQFVGIFNVHDGNPQLRSSILNTLRDEKTEPAVTAQRLLECRKLFTSGFRPLYADYFAGVQEAHN